MINRVKGTQDLIDLSLWQFLTQAIEKHFALYDFNRIETPVIEHTELFQRSLGLETDVVSKEMFIIKSHEQDGKATICLRPEATASIVRAFIENNIEHTPWKVYTTGPIFRYERPQKGRYRQFHQASLEMIGAANISYDVELLAMLDHLFRQKLLLNNFALMINFLGCIEDRKDYRAQLFTFLEQHVAQLDGLCQDRMHKNSMRVFDCKNESCQEIYQKAPKITDYLCASCGHEWQQLQQQLELLSISFVHNPKLVRGLDYYSKTVFEFTSAELGAQSAFCGGGRYDQLVSQLGAKMDQPAIGAGIGLERVIMLLEPIKNSLPLSLAKPMRVIIPLDQAQHMLALLIADELRAVDIPVTVLFDGSFKSMMKKANKLAAQEVILIGQEEQDARQVTVKNMMTGNQERVNQIDLKSYLKK